MRDRDERDKFKEMAYTDSLTGANNRAFMDRKMEELGEAGETFGIVVADIDRFKVINDTYNHAVGDEVLRHFTKFLKSYLHEDDLLFRSGGEEFTLLLRKRSFEEMYGLLERIKQELEHSFVIVEFNGDDKRIHAHLHSVSITNISTIIHRSKKGIFTRTICFFNLSDWDGTEFMRKTV